MAKKKTKELTVFQKVLGVFMATWITVEGFTAVVWLTVQTIKFWAGLF